MAKKEGFLYESYPFYVFGVGLMGKNNYWNIIWLAREDTWSV